MRVIARIGLILTAGLGATIAPGVASADTGSADPEARLVVRPTLTDAEPALELASFGVAELAPEGERAIPVLHIRAVISNGGDRAWVFDASRARLAATGTAVAPAFVNADTPLLPIAILDPGERYAIDLFFPIPAELAGRGGPAHFALTWPISTPTRVVRHACFERAAATAQNSDKVGFLPGLGPTWWFDPKYPWSRYFHQPGYAVPRPPSYVVINRSPRWDAPLVNEAILKLLSRERECDDW